MLGLRTATAATLLAGVCVALLAGCGEEKLSAEEFVQRVQDEGVSIRLGDELITNDSDKQIYAVKLRQLAPVKKGQEPFNDGSLTVYGDTDGADGGLEQCTAAGLACYQAANVVLAFEGAGIEARQLAVAIQRLGD